MCIYREKKHPVVTPVLHDRLLTEVTCENVTRDKKLIFH